MIKAVIFDMDGVLFDTEALHMKATNLVLKPHGVRMENRDYGPYIGMKTIEFFQELKKRYNLPGSPESMTEKSHDLCLQLYKTELRPMSHARETVERLGKELPLAVASSSPLHRINHNLQFLGIIDRFNTLFSGDQVRQGKPHPDIFLRTAEKLGVRPEECIVIEDSAKGIAAAKGAGMKCIALQGVFGKYQDFSEADMVVEDLGNITKEMLERI